MTIKTLLAATMAASLTLLTACGADTADSGAVKAAENTDGGSGSPLMYRVTDPDSEVILFGTFHILPEGMDWKSDELEAAIARAEEVWYELPAGSENDPAAQQLSMQYGMSDVPLTSRLTSGQRRKLEKGLEEAGLPLAAFEPMQPWLAAVSIPLFQMMQAGYSPEQGAEMQLQQLTGDKGQRAFETIEQQLRFFADMPEERQIDYLMQSVEDAGENLAMTDRLAKAWAEGDYDFIETRMIAEMKSETPELYDVLLVQRNRDWVQQLDAELKGAGVDFVAVGAGHLVGPDGVPELLEDLGYDVELIGAR